MAVWQSPWLPAVAHDEQFCEPLPNLSVHPVDGGLPVAGFDVWMGRKGAIAHVLLLTLAVWEMGFRCSALLGVDDPSPRELPLRPSSVHAGRARFRGGVMPHMTRASTFQGPYSKKLPPSFRGPPWIDLGQGPLLVKWNRHLCHKKTAC